MVYLEALPFDKLQVEMIDQLSKSKYLWKKLMVLPSNDGP